MPWSQRKDIDLIDIASPNDTHAEIAIAAAKAGKMVLCEKPLGEPPRKPRRMVDAVEAANVPNMVWYNYRRVPAVVLLKQLLDEGRFGRIFHYRSQFLQDWTISQDLPQGGEGLWRLDASVAGSGVTGDLLAHNIDMALWLNGPITEVSAMTETFIKERKHNLTGKVEPVTYRRRQRVPVPLCKMARLALFEATRYARGHKALFTLEINGERASARWDLHDLHRLDYFDHRDEGRLRGWKSIHITDGDHPYMKNWWVPGLQIGYEHTFIHQVADFLQATGRARRSHQPFRMVWRADYVTDAVLKSAKTRQWETVPIVVSSGAVWIKEKYMPVDFFRSTRVLAGASLSLHCCCSWVGLSSGYLACLRAAGACSPLRLAAGCRRFVQPEPIDFNDHDGWTQIFDGKTLNGWDGPPEVWHVEDGAIVGESSHRSILRGRPISSGAAESRETSTETGDEARRHRRQWRHSVPQFECPPKPRAVPAERLAQMTDEQKQSMKQMEEISQEACQVEPVGYQADFDYNNRYTGQLYEQSTARGIIAWRGQMVATEAGKKPRLLATLGKL